MLGASTAIVLLAEACGPRPATPPMLDGLRDLQASAAALYEAYGDALSVPRREAIAGFYHPDGALIVLNGHPTRRTRAAIDSNYRGPWNPPAFFSWDSLAFDSIAPGQVIVTGHFRWQSAGQPDTGRYIYAALLEAVDSGLAIRFEHETPAPPR